MVWYGEVSDKGYTVNGQRLTSWNLIRDDNGRITQKTERVDGVIFDFAYTYDSVGTASDGGKRQHPDRRLCL